MPTGLLVLPRAWPLWVISGGLAQGGIFTVITMLIVAAAPGSVSVLASRVQAAGYAAAAAGPVALGALLDASHGWTVPLMTVQAALLIMTLAGAAAAIMLRRSTSNHGPAASPASGSSGRPAAGPPAGPLPSRPGLRRPGRYWSRPAEPELP